MAAEGARRWLLPLLFAAAVGVHCEARATYTASELREPGTAGLGWIGQIRPAAQDAGELGRVEDKSDEVAHAVGVLGRLDPEWRRAERVRAQARSVAAKARQMERSYEADLAGLLEQGSKAGMHTDALLAPRPAAPSGRAQTARPGTPVQLQPRKQARPSKRTGPSLTRARSVEHGSNSLLRTLQAAATLPLFPKLPIPEVAAKATASTHATRHRHGSNTLLGVLKGHTGGELRTGRHSNTLFYHATAPNPPTVHSTQALSRSRVSVAAARRDLARSASPRMRKGVSPAAGVEHERAKRPSAAPSSAQQSPQQHQTHATHRHRHHIPIPAAGVSRAEVKRRFKRLQHSWFWPLV